MYGRIQATNEGAYMNIYIYTCVCKLIRTIKIKLWTKGKEDDQA